MHGLIFMTWEKYLGERFGSELLARYRETIGEAPANAPLASRLYDDETLLAGVGAASQLTHQPVERLLREYGRYFIINGLTGHLCKYILDDVSNARELLLTMRDVHARLRCTAHGLTPPLFNYEASERPDTVVLLYDSERHICPVLWGAIEGAAERYGEQVQIIEHSCMNKGAHVCRFEVTFFQPAATSDRKRPARARSTTTNSRLEFAEFVLSALPPDNKDVPGMTLEELHDYLQYRRNVNVHLLRPAILLETLQNLQFAGHVATSGGRSQDNLTNRRYWRVQTYWDQRADLEAGRITTTRPSPHLARS